MKPKIVLGLATALAFTLVLTSYIIVSRSFPLSDQLFTDKSSNGTRCNTTGCRRMAEYLLNSIDYSIKPCDDFYRFACGKIINDAAKNNSDTKISIFDEAPVQIEAEIKKLLEDTSTYPSGNNKNLIRLRNYYTSCMNETRLLELGINPLVKVLERLGGFPILGDGKYGWKKGNEKLISWQDLLVRFRFLGIGEPFILSLSIRPNFENNSLAGIYLDQPSIEPKDLLLELSASKDFAFLQSSLTYFGDAKLEDGQLRDVFAFKSDLMKIMSTKSMLSVDYTKMRLNSFDSLNLNVTNVTNFVLKMMNRTLPDDQLIQVNLEYLVKLDKFLSGYDPKVVLNFMYYKLIHQLRNYLYNGWNEEKNCISLIQEQMTFSISHEYVKNFVDEKTRKLVLDLVERIKRQAKDSIEDASWIKGSTMQVAKDKVDSIRPIVGYATQLMNSTLIEMMSISLDLNPLEFLENHLKITVNDYDLEYAKFGKDQSETYWEISSLTTESNALYLLQFNTIYINAGIMISRFFDSTNPNYINYGSIGSLIGHEISHAFDPMGSQYDKFGNRLMTTWWDDDTLVGFNRNKDCFEQKYNNLSVSGNEHMKINSTLTLDENIADNGGIQLAYNAYKRWLEETGDELKSEPLLPGLDFTQDQLFWLSLATIWCNHVDPVTSALMAKVDPHSPAKYRVNIPFSNAHQFSQAFHCSPQSAMNETNKCVVW